MEKQLFLEAVRQNAARVTHYESGRDGSDGGCDCIGLIIGALRLLGVQWQGTHGSNYTARYAMRTLHPVQSADDLAVGELVFKAREKGEQGYALPDRYAKHEDTRDYYHVGVVTETTPLEILHCSTGGMHRDTALGKWRYAGFLSGMEEEQSVSRQAVVKSENGRNVNLRAEKSTSARRLLSVPCGTRVQVHEEAAQWAHVTVGEHTGYMMRTFLAPCDEVTLTLPRDTAQALLEALKSSLGA